MILWFLLSYHRQGDLIIADCHKGTKNGEYFQLIIDSVSKECISSPEKKDIDVSAAYSRIYHLLKESGILPKETSAEWG